MDLVDYIFLGTIGLFFLLFLVFLIAYLASGRTKNDRNAKKADNAGAFVQPGSNVIHSVEFLDLNNQQTYKGTFGDYLTIGRGGCDINIDDRTFGIIQCRIDCMDKRFFVTNLSPETCAVKVRNNEVSDEREIVSSDWLTIGSRTFQVTIE